jgi:hypothetical protein
MTEKELQVVGPDGLVNEPCEAGYDEYPEQKPPSRVIEDLHEWAFRDSLP